MSGGSLEGHAPPRTVPFLFSRNRCWCAQFGGWEGHAVDGTVRVRDTVLGHLLAFSRAVFWCGLSWCVVSFERWRSARHPSVCTAIWTENSNALCLSQTLHGMDPLTTWRPTALQPSSRGRRAQCLHGHHHGQHHVYRRRCDLPDVGDGRGGPHRARDRPRRACGTSYVVAVCARKLPRSVKRARSARKCELGHRRKGDTVIGIVGDVEMTGGRVWCVGCGREMRISGCHSTPSMPSSGDVDSNCTRLAATTTTSWRDGSHGRVGMGTGGGGRS
ncbi:hypothetical protein BC628DRAFT_139032 [Trametes gibbosa]|nr:hypothetical protein BC628DRAFT_139032 [Trametes gibbosa]